MHVPRKRFGQHFLQDTGIIQHIVNVIAPHPGQHLVEIGPGLGALTLPILKHIGHLDVIELDRDLIPSLETRCANQGTLTVYQADALKFDFAQLVQDSQPLRVIGNLPYNISTPIIFHLLQFAAHISDMHFMLQKEVVDRMAAKPNDDAYGRLSVMVQYQCEVTALFDVPPDAFHPPPKVDSSIVRLTPYQKIPYLADNYEHFENLVKQAFGQRRKTLRNSLRKIITDKDWEQIHINSTLRAEELSVADYVALSNMKIQQI